MTRSQRFTIVLLVLALIFGVTTIIASILAGASHTTTGVGVLIVLICLRWGSRLVLEVQQAPQGGGMGLNDPMLEKRLKRRSVAVGFMVLLVPILMLVIRSISAVTGETILMVSLAISTPIIGGVVFTSEQEYRRGLAVLAFVLLLIPIIVLMVTKVFAITGDAMVVISTVITFIIAIPVVRYGARS